MIERILTTIVYAPTVPDWRPEEATPLAGFSLQLCEASPYFGALCRLPTTILDFMPEHHVGFLSRRLCGTAPLEVHPQSPRAIRSQPIPDVAPFTVLILSPGESPDDYRDWIASCSTPPILVSKDSQDLGYGDLTLEGLQGRFLKLCDDAAGRFAPDILEEARAAIAAWRPLPVKTLDYDVAGHGSIRPNLAALHAAGRKPRFSGPFQKIGDDWTPYVDQIVRTANSVLEAREEQAPSLPESSFPRRPALTLFSPAMYSDLSGVRLAEDAPADMREGFQNVLNLLRRQDGYSFTATTTAQFKAMSGLTRQEFDAGKQPSPHPAFLLRQRETAMAVAMSELLSASEASASLRFPNEINRTAGAVRQFAAHYRSAHRKPQRTLTGFRDVQARLSRATPPEFLEVIRKAGPDIRIVGDAHLEWLDIDGLPLCLRKTVSRIPVTPGNLFVDQMTAKPILRLTPENANKILILSALKPEDEIRAMFRIAFGQFAPLWRDVLDVTFKEVANETDLVEALNAFDGGIVIFDGHGVHVPGRPAQLKLKDQLCDIWSLRGRLLSPPPIMILSACDTHAADRNHATTANGFLALGVRAVLGSAFPLDARDAAAFAARLIYRFSAYVPAAVKLSDRAVTWSEVCSGLLKMQVETDLRVRLVRRGLLNDEGYSMAGYEGNRAINGGHPDPFTKIVENLVEMGLARADVERELALTIASSSAISYLHLGRPETILIDTAERLAKAEAELDLGGEILASRAQSS